VALSEEADEVRNGTLGTIGAVVHVLAGSVGVVL
jgi:hypothetical protein